MLFKKYTDLHFNMNKDQQVAQLSQQEIRGSGAFMVRSRTKMYRHIRKHLSLEYYATLLSFVVAIVA